MSMIVSKKKTWAALPVKCSSDKNVFIWRAVGGAVGSYRLETVEMGIFM